MQRFWLNIYVDYLSRLDPRTRTEKFFCLNAGGCGSTYLVELLKANGLTGCHHEKEPALDKEGIQFYLDGRLTKRVVDALWKYRRNIFLESSNRLFALAGPISRLFPKAQFIHLHRDGKSTLSSMATKTVFEECFRESKRPRYASRLAGPQELEPFERACHYWNNYNLRIHRDLESKSYLSLKFEDLTSGAIDDLASFLQVRLETRTIEAVNTKQNIKSKGWDQFHFENWSSSWKRTFESICGKTNRLLGYE